MNILEKKGDSLDSSIFWDCMVEPQSDQYDSLVALEFVHRSGYSRPVIGEDPTFFDGKVALRDNSVRLESYCVTSPFDHPNIERACNLIKLWPSAFTQFQLLIESVSPFINTKDKANISCSSHSKGFGQFGQIAATIDHSVAFAEALVHEMAHHKLYALGIHLESSERIVKNSPQQKFKSPIRYDCLRPMPAVFHAQYSFTYVLALDIKIIKACDIVSEHERFFALNSLAFNISRLEFGYHVISENAEFDSAGSKFFKKYSDWLHNLFSEGYKILEDFQISRQNFVHPLETDLSYENNLNIYKFDDVKPCRLNEIEEHNSGDEAILYLQKEEITASLNNSAKEIWQLCDGKLTIAEISHKLSLRFGCSDKDLLLDVKAAITQFNKLGLLNLKRN